MFNPAKLVHYSVNLLIGQGELRMENDINNRKFSYDKEDSLSIIEPGVNINLNKFSELESDLTYQFINGSTQTVLHNTDLKVASITISVMFVIY